MGASSTSAPIRRATACGSRALQRRQRRRHGAHDIDCRETAAFGINCNCLSPGFTDTATDRLVERGIRTAQASEYLQRLNQMQMDITPMSRPATSEEQAAAIAFLASDDVGHITGQVLSSSGGMNMQ